MTIEQCYKNLGGDYAQAERRLMNNNLIHRFVTKFLDDSSFSELCSAMKDGDRQGAFRAAHTLKGVCANLSFSRLLSSVSELTELLRAENETIPNNAAGIFQQVEQDYELTVNCIRAYLSEAS